jgi:CO/xanthine dehydrogenase FAD-binding subunit
MAATERYLMAHSLEEAVLAAAGGNVTLLAGGTDLLPRLARGLIQRPRVVVSLNRIENLRKISRTDGEVRVGACAPLSEIASDPIIRDTAPILAHAAERVACPQVRNRATIGGNLCNASPAADTALPLLLLDAVLELASANGDGVKSREVPIGEFFRGPGSTVLEPGEILTQIQFRRLTERTFAAWDKFGTRPAMEIAVASVGVALKIESEKVTHARVGYGSVAPVPMRGHQTEACLLGNPLSEETIRKCEASAKAEISPITDVRGSEEYRREMVGVLLRRMLQDARRG